jgi:N,N'-diacetyllegionaminate synthase
MNLQQYAEQGRTFVIAEIAQAHDGSVGILHSLLEAAAKTGVDAVKFQVHIADAESSDLEPFRIPFSYVDARRIDYWRRMELSFEDWQRLKDKCDALGVEFLATPFSNAAVELLERLQVRRYKVGSGDLGNPLLLERIARTGKEVILSTGLGDLDDIDRAVARLRAANVPVAVLQCTTKYPTQAADIGLGWLAELRERYGCPVGLSDHSATLFAPLGAVALGANVIEAHVTFDRRMFGPDAPASLTIDEFAELVRGIRFLEQARGTGPDKALTEAQRNLRRMFGKALAVNRAMSAGEVVRFEDLEGKKPADAGLPVGEMDAVIGRTLIRDKASGEFLQQEDFR